MTGSSTTSRKAMKRLELNIWQNFINIHNKYTQTQVSSFGTQKKRLFSWSYLLHWWFTVHKCCIHNSLPILTKFVISFSFFF